MRDDVLGTIGVPPFAIPLHVLHVWDDETPQQARRQAARMALAQAGAGWRISVAAPDAGEPEPVERYDWADAEGLATLTEELDPDVVVTHGSASGVLTRRTLRDRHVIVCLSPARRGHELAETLAEFRTSRWCNAMVVPDARTSDWFRRRGIRVPLFLVEPGSSGASELWAAVTARAYAFGG
ncbi:MAG: hypothetical protein KDC39_14390 [Actinobacteria bacterium]|nr:hypothetical protein [Actinomycetota bacterium]HRY10193.1 hypothetical protein [Candidatus Nanopelagicales bacterium]